MSFDIWNPLNHTCLFIYFSLILIPIQFLRFWYWWSPVSDHHPRHDLSQPRKQALYFQFKQNIAYLFKRALVLWVVCVSARPSACDGSQDLNPVPSGVPNYVVAKRAKDGFLQCSQWGSRKQEFQMSKLDFIIRITKPRWQARNIWIFVCPLTLYTCGTAQTWEFLFLIGYACLTCHS